MICNLDDVFRVLCQMEQKTHLDISCSLCPHSRECQRKNLLKKAREMLCYPMLCYIVTFVILNNYSMSARWIRASLAIIISYPTSASGIIVLLKTPPKYRKVDLNKNKKAQKLTHTLAIFVDHGVMAHIP